MKRTKIKAKTDFIEVPAGVGRGRQRGACRRSHFGDPWFEALADELIASLEDGMAKDIAEGIIHQINKPQS